MIPILYSAAEVDFETNGLGALSDITSCSVTEEQNGVYELEMSYPVFGRHYSLIELDAIIYAQPADGKSPQPFQVYKISDPLDDVVTIYAQHISYRLSFIPVMPLTLTGSSATLNGLKSNSIVEHPFTVWTDINNTTITYSRDYPSSFRECLGGTDGSFISIFGGEVEWDRFVVKLHQNRGSDTGIRIAYSKNITSFTNEEANDGVITSIYPYWKDSQTSELVTCGVVYAIKDVAYSAVPAGSSPTWEENKYYKIKTTGYYKNDEDWAPTWLLDTYYYAKPTGYYRVAGASAPTWTTNTYYAVLPYGFFLITNETVPDFAYDTYYEKTSQDYVQLNEATAPTWIANTYYSVSGETYTLTTSQPANWSTTFNNYYTKEAATFEVLTAKPYDWGNDYLSYYIYVEPQYVLTTSRPSTWSTTYMAYFVYYTYNASSPIYILTTSEPYDWNANFNDYYVHYTVTQGTTDYTVTLSQPVNWSTTYATYYTRWETRYSDDYAFPRLVSADFSSAVHEKPTERMLRRLAREYISASLLTEKAVTLDLSFVALWQTEEYKNLAPLERVNLCDIVTVDLRVGEVAKTVKLKVIKTEYDVLSEKYTNVTLGNSTSTLASTFLNLNDAIKEATNKTISTLQAALEYQATLLNGGLGGNVKINYNEKNLPSEIVVGDSDDIFKMINVLRINYRGIGFSKNGYNGPYTSIWGLDGEFDAQCIKVASLDGTAIKAGTIQASSFSSTVTDELLADANTKISKIESDLALSSSKFDDWLEIRNGLLYIGQRGSNILLRAQNNRISFIDESMSPPKELAYISNNQFFTNELRLGGYKLSASDDVEEGISFSWVGV